MAKYRPIKTSFWEDEWIASLNASEKLLFLYLLTNPHTSLCGIYTISIRYLVFETGLTEEVVKKCLDRFTKDGKATYKDGWIILKNTIKHQTQSPKVQEGIKREISEIPQEIANLRYHIDTISIHMDKPILKLKPKLEPILKNPIITKVIEQAPKQKNDLPKKDKRDPAIDQILTALKALVGVDDFADSQRWQRIYGKLCLDLSRKLGKEEFRRRLTIIKKDSFKYKRCNEIRYLYEQVKGFLEPVSPIAS